MERETNVHCMNNVYLYELVTGRVCMHCSPSMKIHSVWVERRLSKGLATKETVPLSYLQGAIEVASEFALFPLTQG